MDDPARDAFVQLGGLAFHYREYEGANPPLVLLHGLASNSRWWLLTAPLLAPRFRVLALDQRGHGESDKPDTGYDFQSIVGDLAAFVQALGVERPVIVGHSWGGNVALEYAAKHPDRAGGLVLVDGGFIDLSARAGMTWERTEREMAPPDLTHLTPRQLVENAKRWELGGFWGDEIETALLANFDVAEDGTLRPRLSRANHMRILRGLWEQRPSGLFPRVRCPVLYIAAERESEGRAGEWLRMKREAIGRAEALLADCQVRWFADTIHDIPLQRPRELAQAVHEFVDGLA